VAELDALFTVIGWVLATVWTANPGLLLILALVVAAACWEPARTVWQWAEELRDHLMWVRWCRRERAAQQAADRVLDAQLAELLEDGGQRDQAV
jgi:hypothetical protein